MKRSVHNVLPSIFSSILPGGVQELINAMLRGKKFKTFPEELRNFAATLHFYSPSGYAFVRKSFMKILPHSSTMSEWLRTVNYEPGISSEALETVSRLIQKNEANRKKLYFNMTVDEMSTVGTNMKSALKGSLI